MSIRLWLWCLMMGCVGSAGCDSQRDVGSTCPDGDCTALGQQNEDDLPCVTHTVHANVAFSGTREEIEAVKPFRLCLPDSLVRGDDGLVSCDVSLHLQNPPDGVLLDCSQPFLAPTGEPGVCTVSQVPALDGERDASLQGWYYEEPSDETSKVCLGTTAGGARFTDDAFPLDGTELSIDCLIATVKAGDYVPAAADPEARVDVDPRACGTPDGAVPPQVGAACQPDVPARGFDPREAFVQSGAGCGSGACLVYQLEGDPRPECEPCDESSGCNDAPRCASPEEVERSVYCSCRCDAAGAAAAGVPSCACPEDFSCTPLLESGAADLAGSYCVRNVAP